MKSIETQVEIRADAETVWSILTEFSAYPAWNPFISEVEGEALPSKRLRVTIRPEEGREMVFRPRIVCFQPGRELRWVGRVGVPGILDGVHKFRIVPTGCGVLLYHCEQFSGIGAAFLTGEGLDRIRKGFEAMNEALRVRAEAAYEEARRKVA